MDIICFVATFTWSSALFVLYRDRANQQSTSLQFIRYFVVICFAFVQLAIFQVYWIINALVLDYTIFLFGVGVWPFVYFLWSILYRTADVGIFGLPDIPMSMIVTFSCSVVLRWIRIRRRHKLTFPSVNAE